MYINEKLKVFWHGGDYNPDQWLDHPEVLKKDIELMKKSGCNAMSVGIFAWSRLEPNEGEFNFAWLDKIIDDLYANGIYTVLATPSGAMPVWMAQKYPETKRVHEDGIRDRFGNRHNNCYSSPIYREKVRIINTKLAQRYAKHPGVVLWHMASTV
jgi:beta-galactosidase